MGRKLYIFPGTSPLVLVDPSGMVGCGSPGCGQHAVHGPTTTGPRRHGRGRYHRPSPPQPMGAQEMDAEESNGGGGAVSTEENGLKCRLMPPWAKRNKKIYGGGWRWVCGCEDQDDWCCSMPTGWGPPKSGHTKGGNKFVKELWASACSCDCHKAGDRDCEGTVNFRRREWRGDSSVLLKDTQKERNVRGKCVPCEGWVAGGPDGPEDPDDPEEGDKCGPDVTAQLDSTMRWVDDTVRWLSQHHTARFLADCLYLNTHFGFDISILVGTYSAETGLPVNATFDGHQGCATGMCTGTVTVEKKCYYAHQVNYVLYGKLTRECGIPAWVAERAVRWHKRRTHRPGEIADAVAWMQTGRANWPLAGSTPPEQVGACADCPSKYQEGHSFCWSFGLDAFSGSECV